MGLQLERLSLVELMQVVAVLLRRWYMIVIPLGIVAMVAVPALLAAPPSALLPTYTTVIRYTAAQDLEAIPNRDGDFQDVWLASELAVNAFTEWIRSSSFAQEVRAALPEGIAPTLSAGNFASDNERSIGQVFITWPDAQELEQIAQAVQTVLETRTNVYFPQLGDVPARVTILDVPQIVAAPIPIANRLEPLIQLAFALVVGVGLAFLAEYLDPFLYRRQQLDALNLTVLACVPRHRKEG